MTAAPYTGPLNWRPTEHRVWRGSYDENDKRAQVFMPFTGRDPALKFIDHFILGMKKLANEKKIRGRAHAITHNMIAVAEAMLRTCTDFSTGRCTPAIETIMEKTRFARPTVIKLLKRLRELVGFDWVRRTVRTGKVVPAVEQTSNAYFIDLARVPRELFGYLRQKLHGVIDLDAAPRHQGSPKLPPFKERLAAKFVKQVTSRFSTSRKGLRGELRSRAEQISSASPAEEARRRWPDDPEAQRFYEESMRSRRGQDASSGSELQSPLKGEKQKE
jgi:hypothetical protein